MATKKSMLVALAVMVTIAFSAFGAEPNMPAEKKVEKNHKGEHRMMGDPVKMRMAELSARLNLTEDQKKSIQPILENEAKEMQALKGDATLSKEQRMEKMKTIRQASHDEMMKALTPEQQAKLGEAKEEKKPEMKEGMKGDASARIQRRMMELNEKLALTPDQKKSIQPIIENEMKDADAVKSDQSLSKEQKIEKMKAIHQTSHDEMMKVLTPEQQTKLEAMKEKAHDKKAELKGKGQQ